MHRRGHRKKMIPIFIGYDPREAVAYHVCSNSIIRQSSQIVAIAPLAFPAHHLQLAQSQQSSSGEFIELCA